MTLAECLQAARDVVADTIRAGLNGDLPHRAAQSLLKDMEDACAQTAPDQMTASWIRAGVTTLDRWRNSAVSMGKPERAEFYRRIVEIRNAASVAIEGR